MRNVELLRQRTIYGALMFSIVIYIFMAFMAARQNASLPFGDQIRLPLVIPFYGIGVLFFAAALFVRARLSSRVRNIVCWALLEVMVVFGLLASFLYHDWRLILPPAMVAILGFLLTFPRAETL